MVNLLELMLESGCGLVDIVSCYMYMFLWL